MRRRVHGTRWLVVGAYGYIWGEYRTRDGARGKANRRCGDRVVKVELREVRSR